REDAGGRTGCERSHGNHPRLASIGRPQDSCLTGGASADPDMILWGDVHVGAARSKGAFILESRPQPTGWDPGPHPPRVAGGENLELMVGRVAERDATRFVPERHRIEESFWIVVDELLSPGGPGIGGLVDLRLLSIPDAQHVSRALVDGVDIPEIELLGTRNL